MTQLCSCLKAFTGSGFRLDGKKKKSNVPSNPVPMGPPVIKRYEWTYAFWYRTLKVLLHGATCNDDFLMLCEKGRAKVMLHETREF